MFDRVIHAGRVAAGRFPDLNATGVHNFCRITPGRVQQPCDVSFQSLWFILLDLLHDVVVVAHQHVEALVDDRRVVQFFMGVPRHQRRNGCVERGCVAESRVEVTGGECAWHASRGSGPRIRCAMHFRGQSFVVRHHLSSHVDLWPGNVAVHVDATRHHDHTSAVDGLVGFHLATRLRDDFTILDPNIDDFAIDAVFRVVNATVLDLQKTHGATR